MSGSSRSGPAPARECSRCAGGVAGHDKSRCFITRALADGYRAELVRAARKGVEFGPATGACGMGRAGAGDRHLVPACGGLYGSEVAVSGRAGHRHPGADQGNRPQASTRSRASPTSSAPAGHSPMGHVTDGDAHLPLPGDVRHYCRDSVGLAACQPGHSERLYMLTLVGRVGLEPTTGGL